ncbi:hypothetical protein Pyn_38031 [Prunus yedoensis var. nudiflora]|uniref:Uncharacterized protein n=1 Tax=Prunus yedoensis var. nudiflora TaxID=2094558 RepID=A0A314UQ07_PRUYE|nr:hypothetical protein Pyn_38031 [Prunus yedoensis var. nudiflora]
MQHEDTLQVNKLDPKHTCARVWENKGIRCSWLAQIFVEEVKTNLTVPVVSFKATMQRSGKKLGRYQDFLKCGTYRQNGHNSLICHRHKPPNDRNRPGKKHKAKAAIGTSIPASKPDNYEAEIERKNQLREKTKQRAKVLKEKRDKKKVEAVATSAVDSSNPTGVVRKRAKCSNTRCNNYASIQESQSGV